MVTLFSNIPTDLILKTVKEKWTRIQLEHCDRILENSIDLLEFTFRLINKFYRQIFELLVVNCLSSIYTYIVVSELHWLYKQSFILHFLKRFADYIVTSTPENQVDNILNVFNSYHNKLQVTFELEK